MLMDSEENVVNMKQTPNPHILVTGTSGYGKTFFCTQFVEEKICMGKRVLIIDFSHSYTKEELKKSHFKYTKFIKILNPVTKNLLWEIKFEKTKIFIDEIVDALIEALSIKGYVQRQILEEGVKNVIEQNNCFSFSQLFQAFEELLKKTKQKEESDKTRTSAICRILDHLMPYKNLASIQVKCSERQQVNRQPITILQLSDYPDTKKGTISSFFVSLIWKEIQHIKERKAFDIILLDEFQKIAISKGSSILQILREGRKFDFGAVLSSQFTGNYEPDIFSTLMQCGTRLFFHPIEKDAAVVAKQLSVDKVKEWKFLLKKLQVGQAVFCGNYSLNDNKKVSDTPILVKIIDSMGKNENI